MQITACSLKFIFHVNVLEGSSNIRENVCLLEMCSAAPPGVSVLVCDHLGPLAGRVLLENLVQLEVVHIRGQVTHKYRELRPAESTALLRQTGTFTSFQMIVYSSSPFSFHRGVSQIWFSQRSSFISSTYGSFHARLIYHSGRKSCSHLCQVWQLHFPGKFTFGLFWFVYVNIWNAAEQQC